MLATQQMGVFPVNPRKERKRAGHGLFFLLFLSTLIACTIPNPKEKNREDTLKRHVRAFHWALIGQDVPIALRYVPADDREAWDDAFNCLFEHLRLLDYRVSLVKFYEESNKASVRVRWTAHRPDSLVVKDLRWKEEWSFDLKKQRWSLLPGPDALKGLPEDCLPAVPESEAPDEDESAD
jgi:hypothetical protein